MVFVSNWLRDWTSTPSRSDSERADIPYPVFGRSVSRQPAVGGVIHNRMRYRPRACQAAEVTDGLSAGVGDGLGSGTGLGSFGSGSGFEQGRTQGSGKLNALVEGAGAANINASLSDVTENMVLGNGVPQLPKGSPGAIIQGRGKEIIGSLNLVRLDDPLHPNLDF